ncbi:STN domain-containing protein, partial [Sphingobacterium sp.]
MKVNLIGGLLLSSSLQLMALTETLGQRMNAVKIHMGSSSLSLKKALQELEHKSGMTIFYPSDLVDHYMAPVMDTQSRSVSETLKLMLQQTNLSFKETSLGV